MATKIQEIGDEIRVKSARLAELATEASEGKYDKAKWEEFKTLQAELDGPDGLGVKHVQMLEAAKVADAKNAWVADYDKPVSRVGMSQGMQPGQAPTRFKSLGELVTESKHYQSRQFTNNMFVLDPEKSSEVKTIFHENGIEAKYFVPNFQTKTLMSESAGFAPPNFRTSLVVFYPTNQPDLVDIVPQFTTNLQVIKYMRGTTWTNNAADAAEGAAVTDSVLVFTEQSDTVRKISAWIPVSDEQLDDVPNIASIINDQLSLQLRLKLQDEMIAGNNTGTQLNGFLTVVTQTQALGADDIPDAIFKGMTLVRYTGRATPSNVVMHPTDWQKVQLLKNQIGDYIWGSPAGSVAQPFIWGLPVLVQTAETQGTILLGDFRNYCRLALRQDVTIETGYNNDDFTKNQKSVKGTVRAALEVTRPNAFALVTGV